MLESHTTGVAKSAASAKMPSPIEECVTGQIQLQPIFFKSLSVNSS